MFKFLTNDNDDTSSATKSTDPTATANINITTQERLNHPHDGSSLSSKDESLASAAEVNVNEKHYQMIAGNKDPPLAYSKITLSNRQRSKTLNTTNDDENETTQIKYIQVPQLLNLTHVEMNDEVKGILQSTSDLIPGRYEGGFKIWECSIDLIKYLHRDHELYPLDKNSTILDLGCGSGLLGLYALSCGSMVHFQDYNREVLDFLTIPNVLLNHGHDDETIASCRFFCGDWKSLQNDLMMARPKNEFQYDYILTSETTYNVSSLSKLYGLIKYCLKPSGVVLLASKTCYFGVGGGTKAFLSCVESDGVMKSEVVCTIKEGVHREIIMLKHKSS